MEFEQIASSLNLAVYSYCVAFQKAIMKDFANCNSILSGYIKGNDNEHWQYG